MISSKSEVMFDNDDLEDIAPKMTPEEERTARRAARKPKAKPQKPDPWIDALNECPHMNAEKRVLDDREQRPLVHWHANRIHIRGHKDVPHGCSTWGNLPRRIDHEVICIEWRPLEPYERPTLAWEKVAYSGQVIEPKFPPCRYMNFEMK